MIGFALLVMATACGQEPPAPPPPTPTQTEEPLPDAPWDNDLALANAIGARHWMPVIMAGQTYNIEHEGRQIELGQPETLVGEDGKVRSYPESARRGHVLAKADAGGKVVSLDYTVEWRAGSTDLGGEFHVVDWEVFDAGAGPRFTFERAGAYWVRKAR